MYDYKITLHPHDGVPGCVLHVKEVHTGWLSLLLMSPNGEDVVDKTEIQTHELHSYITTHTNY